MEIRIVLADDHQLFLEGLRGLLSRESDMTIVGEATSGVRAVEVVRAAMPNVVILDVSMPELNGIEATRKILAENPGTKILCVSMHGHEEYVSAALRHGASGYLKKECTAKELVRAIRSICAGETYLSPAVAGVVVGNLRSGLPGTNGPRTLLSAREVEVLQLIAEGYETKEIADKLNLSTKTIASHRAHIIEKLGVRGVAGLTRYAIRHRIVDDEPKAS